MQLLLFVCAIGVTTSRLYNEEVFCCYILDKLSKFNNSTYTRDELVTVYQR